MVTESCHGPKKPPAFCTISVIEHDGPGKTKAAESRAVVARAELGGRLEGKGHNGTFGVSGNAPRHDLGLVT